MATIIEVPDPQFLVEVRTYTCDFTQDLLGGVTVVSATATHVPPAGSASTPLVAVSGSLVNVTLGPLAVTGTHYLDVLATASDGEKSAMRLILQVPQ